LGDVTKYVRATSMNEAARTIAYWYAELNYGKKAIIVDCNSLYVTNQYAEFETTVGYLQHNKLIGHNWRFIVYKKNTEVH
jgi:hypothetical protein